MCKQGDFTVAAALEIAGLDHVVVFSAIADGHTLARNPDARLYLDRNDSYHYFQPLGDLPPTPTSWTSA